MNTNYEKDFVPYEEALELKKLGFDEPCFAVYIDKTLIIEDDWLYSTNQDTFIESSNFTAPLYSQAFRWFREKYVLLGFIEPANGYEDKSLFAFYICDDEQNIVDDSHSYSKDSSLHFRTYEEAELECLKKLIEIVKQQL